MSENFPSFLVFYTLLAWLLYPAYREGTPGLQTLYAVIFPFHLLVFAQVDAVRTWMTGLSSRTKETAYWAIFVIVIVCIV